ncbi:hypothetical protein Ancab_010439 [Ancistrocladus abbreviatus]
MVTLPGASMTLKLPIPRLIRSKLKPSMKLPHSAPPSLLVSNLQQPEHLGYLSSPANQSVAAILLGDGLESQLWPLMKRRSAGAIPIAANYRLIDGVVSNCINSNITKIYALTQFNSTSLNSHLSRAYSNIGLGKDGFVEVIAAYQSPENQGWFQGNADAVRRCLGVLEEYPLTEFLILPGHHLYKMDYQKLLQSHRKSKADITISALSSGKDHDTGFGILRVNSENQVLELGETLKTQLMFPPGFSEENSGSKNIASMGIYVINKDAMVKILREYFPRANDFKTEVIPGAISLGMKVQAHLYDGHWENMVSIKTFYEANMATMKSTNVIYNFFDAESPLYTLPRCLPPTRVTDAVITDSIIGDGCILNRCKIKGTVVGLRARISDDVVIEDSVVMGSDFYQVREHLV